MSDMYGVPRRRLVGEGAFWLTIIGVLIVVITIVGLGWRYVIAGPSGKVQAREQILSGSNRIQAYNHFFDLCASVQNAEAAIQTTFDQLKTSTDPDDRERLQTNLSAQIITRQSGINQYNVDARKSYTIGQFRSLQLPYQLPTAAFQSGDTQTSCQA
jgi:hypothetical protein